ncbi:MAG: NarK/NasA family nitrate transporter [Acidobacteria bacterium]|nr:NarK/NasA family nitrate transporter [Acidobacteriota bacterium]
MILSTLAFALCFAVWGSVAPLAPIFRETYGLSQTGVGFLIAVPVILGSLARVPLGVLTERFGGRAMFAALLLFLIVPSIAMGFAGSYAGLIGTVLVLGIAGASFAIGIPFVNAWFPPERQGFALGIYGAGNIGTAIAAKLGPYMAAHYGIAWAFWIYVPALAVFGVVFWLTARDAAGARRPAGSLRHRLAVLHERPFTWVPILFYFVTFGGFVAIGAFLPIFLVTRYELTIADAGTRTAGFVLLATLARPIGGWVSDRWGSVPTLNFTFVIVALFAIVMAFEAAMAPMTVAFLGTACALGLGNGAVFKLVAERFPGQTGVVGGLVGAAGGLGGFFPPLVMGAVKDATGSYAIGFMLLSEFALLCLVVNLLAVQGGVHALLGPEAAQPGPFGQAGEEPRRRAS